MAKGVASFVPRDGPPYVEVEPIDFPDAERDRVFALYRETYARVAGDGAGAVRLNITNPLALHEFDRFILFTDGPRGQIVGFVLAKTTIHGVKLCLTGHDGGHSKVLILFHLDALNQDGVFAEVSDPLENRLGDDVPSVSATDAARVLEGKAVTPSTDRVHYSREISNLGPHEKKMVGRPRIDAKRRSRARKRDQ